MERSWLTLTLWPWLSWRLKRKTSWRSELLRKDTLPWLWVYGLEWVFGCFVLIYRSVPHSLPVTHLHTHATFHWNIVHSPSTKSKSKWGTLPPILIIIIIIIISQLSSASTFFFFISVSVHTHTHTHIHTYLSIVVVLILGFSYLFIIIDKITLFFHVELVNQNFILI